MATVIANWKMNPLKLQEAMNMLDLLKQKESIFKERDVEIIISPPSIFLEKLKTILEDSNIKLAVQNISYEEDGAFTGEISASMVKNIGCECAIVGHSERRKLFCESNDDINKKLKLAYKNKLLPILCIGEDRVEKENGQTMQVVEEQLNTALKEITEKMILNQGIYIAYEPVWAIGTGNNADQEEVLSINIFIKKILIKLYGRSILKKIKILYGGSVSGKNAYSYIEESGMNGLLIGGASLKINELMKIIESV